MYFFILVNLYIKLRLIFYEKKLSNLLNNYKNIIISIENIV